MPNRVALAIAAGITFVAIVVGGVIAYYVAESATPTSVVAAVQTDPVSVQPSIRAEVQSLIDTREAAYRQALADANSKLEQANAQLRQAYDLIGSLKQVSTLPQATIVPQATETAQPVQSEEITQTYPAPGYAISAGGAVAIALSAEPGTSLMQTPGLVSFQGTAAYEVQLDLGTVYVDANSGKVLYDSVVPPQVFTSSPQPGEREQYKAGGDD